MYIMRYTNTYNLPEEIVKAITNDNYDHPTDERTIPCSKLISPARITILSKRHDKEIIKDISDEIWALLGTSVHYIIAKQDSGDAISEQRFYAECGEYTISGKPDLFCLDGEIKDYKVTSVYKVIFGSKEGYKDWTEQLNVYAWLLRKNGWKVAKLTITAILRDWSQRDALKGGDYPNIQVKEIDLPLWSEEEQEKFVCERLQTLVRNDSLPDDELDLCTPEERWASATTWALMKEGRKSALRVFNSSEDAQIYRLSLVCTDINLLYVVERPGKDKRCAQYCDCNQFCKYYKENDANI